MRSMCHVAPWVLACLLLLGNSAHAQDYMDPDLRERVESLKTGVALMPTTRTNLQERSAVLWDWANAYALAGGYLPVNLTTATRPELPDDVRVGDLSAFDGYVRELALHDERPDAVGPLSAHHGPFEARSYASFEQVHTVGTRAISAGGGIVVARHFNADYGRFQAHDPAAPNYVAIASSSADARFAADGLPLAGMHGGFRGAEPVLFFRLTTGSLEPDDTVTVTYGSREDGSPGQLMPSFSSDMMPFPIYLKYADDEHLYSLPIQPVRVTGTRLAGVHGFAPSVVRPGEEFNLTVRAQDIYYNRALPPYPGWQVFANDRMIGELAPAQDAITVLEGVSFDEAGVYRITIRSSDGRITGPANPVLVSADAQRVFWGDTHGHSGFAEGVGTPDRFMTWARDDARLDFVTHSEHDIWMDDAEWEVLRANISRYSEEGRFIAYLGYEWTTHYLYGGHHNVLFRTPEGRERIPTQFYPVLSELYAGLRADHDPRDVVVIPHAHNPGNYRLSDPQLQPLVEIMSQHGSFEWLGRMYLSHGHQVGFTAASDNHLSQPGYTAPKGGGLSQRGGLGAVLAPELSRDAIFDAMKSLSAYATTGDRIILDVSLNGTGMGKRAEFAERRQIRGRVIGTAPIESIVVVRNDEELWRRDYLTAEEGPFAAEEVFYVSFASESFPMHRGDAPRGWRPWKGRLQVDGAELVDVAPTDFVNADAEQLVRDPTNPNALEFSTATRGDSSSLRLTLKDIRPDATVRVSTVSGREFGSGPPTYRRPAMVPAAELELPLAELERGVLSRSVPFDVYQDTVTVRRHLTDGADDISFEVEDRGTVQGDYYFVRVKQVDDAIAWSSPIWVGGHPPR